MASLRGDWKRLIDNIANIATENYSTDNIGFWRDYYPYNGSSGESAIDSIANNYIKICSVSGVVVEISVRDNESTINIYFGRDSYNLAGEIIFNLLLAGYTDRKILCYAHTLIEGMLKKAK